MNLKILGAIMFGIIEQTIALATVFSGILSFSKNKILFTILLISISNSLPDTLGYYTSLQEENISEFNKILYSVYVEIVELLIGCIFMLIIFFINNKNLRSILFFGVASLILYFSEILSHIYLKDKKKKDKINIYLFALIKLFLAILICLLVYLISNLSQKYLGISI